MGLVLLLCYFICFSVLFCCFLWPLASLPVFICFPLCCDVSGLVGFYSICCSFSPFSNAGSFAVKWFSACCSFCLGLGLGCSSKRTLSLLTALCGNICYLDGPGHLFDLFQMILVISALFVGCFGTTVRVACPLFLFMM
jgi:hypothetical protein